MQSEITEPELSDTKKWPTQQFCAVITVLYGNETVGTAVKMSLTHVVRRTSFTASKSTDSLIQAQAETVA